MPKSVLTIALLATGLSLSIALAGCARLDSRPATPAAVAVKVERLPPVDLLICPRALEGFPPDAVATMPPAVRFAAIRLATAYAATVDRLERLIRWEAPGSCPTPEPAR